MIGGVACAPGSLLYILGFVFLIMIIIGVFTPSNVYYLVISAVAAVLFSSYLLADLQVRQQPLIFPSTHYPSHGIQCAAFFLCPGCKKSQGCACLQAIMGGRTVELSPDDYVYAAVQVICLTFWYCPNNGCHAMLGC